MVLRPRQWIKNLVVFAGLLFAGKFAHPREIEQVVLAFIIFCAVSSVGYLINDVLDVEKDRAHPVKCRRPIAAGRIPPAAAIVYAVILGIGSLAGAILLQTKFAAVAIAYLAITLTYSLYWKRQVLLDLLAIAGGFLLRALAGTEILHVSISPWLFVCVTLLALLLGLCKRRHELNLLADDAHLHRPVLVDYSRPFLDQAMTMVSSAAIVTYAVYAISSPSAHNHPGLVFTVPLVFYGLLRYTYLVMHHDMGGHPEEIFLTDRPMLLTILLWTVTVIIVFTWSVKL